MSHFYHSFVFVPSMCHRVPGFVGCIVVIYIYIVLCCCSTFVPCHWCSSSGGPCKGLDCCCSPCGSGPTMPATALTSSSSSLRPDAQPDRCGFFGMMAIIRAVKRTSCNQSFPVPPQILARISPSISVYYYIVPRLSKLQMQPFAPRQQDWLATRFGAIDERTDVLEEMQLEYRDELRDHIEATEEENEEIWGAIDQIDTRTEVLEDMQLRYQQGRQAARQELWGAIRSLERRIQVLDSQERTRPLWAHFLLWIFIMWRSVHWTLRFNSLYIEYSDLTSKLEILKPIGLKEVIEECQLPEFPGKLHPDIPDGFIGKWLLPTVLNVEVSGEQLGSFLFNSSLHREDFSQGLQMHQWCGGAVFQCSHCSGEVMFGIGLPCSAGNACTLFAGSKMELCTRDKCFVIWGLFVTVSKTHQSLDSWCHNQALDLGKKAVERRQLSHHMHYTIRGLMKKIVQHPFDFLNRLEMAWNLDIQTSFHSEHFPNSLQRLTNQLMFSSLTALYALLNPFAPRLWRQQILDLLGRTYWFRRLSNRRVPVKTQLQMSLFATPPPMATSSLLKLPASLSVSGYHLIACSDGCYWFDDFDDFQTRGVAFYEATVYSRTSGPPNGPKVS